MESLGKRQNFSTGSAWMLVGKFVALRDQHATVWGRMALRQRKAEWEWQSINVPFCLAIQRSKWAFVCSPTFCEHFLWIGSFLPPQVKSQKSCLPSTACSWAQACDPDPPVTLVKLPFRRDQSEEEMPHGIHFHQWEGHRCTWPSGVELLNVW